MQLPSSPTVSVAQCAAIPGLNPNDPVVRRLLSPWVTPPDFPEAVLRLRLLDRLDRALTHPLTMLTAPPGAGKTVLLSQWVTRLRSRSDAPHTAWLTIVPGVHEPPVLAQALQVALLHAGVPFEPFPGVSDHPSLTAEATLVHLGLHAFSTPTVLVIDGVELLGPAAQALVAQLVEHAPPTLRLVFSGRSAPNLPLPRLRLQRALLEVRDADLRWNAADAAALLRGVLKLPISAADIDRLAQHSAGWVTGLCLAGFVYQAQDAPDGPTSFSGADHVVVDYVATEVLAPHPPIVQSFLLRSAALPELTLRAGERILRSGPPDADGLGLNSPQAMLTYLERHNLFVEPLDRQRTRYRLNPLVAEALAVLRSMQAPEPLSLPPIVGAALPDPAPADLEASEDTWLITEALSDREQQILRLAAGGLPNREIAQQLWISEATVKSHLKRIFGKLGARNRTEAVAIARKRQLVSVV